MRGRGRGRGKGEGNRSLNSNGKTQASFLQRAINQKRRWALDIADGLYTEPSAAAEKEADDDLDDAGSDEMGEDSEKDEETADERIDDDGVEVVESQPMQEARLRFGKAEPQSNKAGADEVQSQETKVAEETQAWAKETEVEDEVKK